MPPMFWFVVIWQSSTDEVPVSVTATMLVLGVELFATVTWLSVALLAETMVPLPPVVLLVKVESVISACVFDAETVADAERAANLPKFLVNVQPVTVKSPNRLSTATPPAPELDALPVMVQLARERLSRLRIAPPKSVVSAPVRVRPEICVVKILVLLPSSMLKMPLPLPSATPGVRSLPLASIVRRSAPGPVIVRESVILSSPWVSKILAGPEAVSAGANSIVSAPGTVLAAKMASRSEVTPSLKSTVSAVVVTVIESIRRSSSGSKASRRV